MEDKKTLRRRFSSVRRDIPDKAAKDAAITERILSLSEVRKADTILLFSPIRSEFDCSRLTEAFLSSCSISGRPVTALPRCGENGIMTFHVITSFDDLSSGAYGIKEPGEDLPEADCSGKTVCIVPGLAFTPSGGRLGYGGGYYDRFLSQHKDIYTIAPVYEALVTDELPLAEHDIKINKLVTEERTVLCNAK